MRCFIGIWVPEGLRKRVEEIQERVKAIGADVKLVESTNLHITLAFLGEVDDKTIKKVVSNLSEIEFSPFFVGLRGLEAFPSIGYIRVLMVGVEKGKEKLAEIQKKIVDSLSGIRIKHAPPHLTLGRVKSAKNKDKLVEFLNREKSVSIGEFEINSFKLMKSELSREGPIYSVIKEFKIG